MSRSYAHVRYPWRAAVATDAAAPARLYAAIVAQAVRYGLPARRRPAALWTRAARRELPVGALGWGIRRLPARPRPDLDELIEAAVGDWSALAERGRSLPSRAPSELSALSLERRAARTVFLFGEGPDPLLVLKVPAGGDAAMAGEAEALREAEPASVGPRFLGRVAGAYAQEVVAGAPLEVQPMDVADARDLRLPAALADAMGGLERLGSLTAKEAPPSEEGPILRLALGYPDLADRPRRRLADAVRRVAALERTVLGHGDTSPQNVHCAGAHMTGLVDWELARTRYLPGVDIWAAAVSYAEHCLGLVRWSDEAVVAAFEAGWSDSPHYRGARARARSAVQAAGLEDADADALELAFFGLRLGRRLERPQDWPTGAGSAARMLETAAAG